ncbi:DUF1774-domain-containing protein [Choiromyces venosus 120613-1]|uniref:DUF1774-domain-containing protein n=1 Tax=Choiromyces venosus 120613-1 TaxID=1336337 RepID=A0A3N4K5W6_9PEZI|nr:DUF1774-domain-containing protein [Choiromyces venosus 120613-1]
MAFSNPFSRDVEGTSRNIPAYRAFTIISWLLSFVAAIVYSVSPPHDVHWASGTIFGVSNAHITSFTISHVFVTIYWVVLFCGQICFVAQLFRTDQAAVTAAASVGSYFILFNLLQFGWIMLWTRSLFLWSELVHLPAAAMPLTWSFFLVLWNGAVMVGCHGLPCRVLANIAIWGIVAFAGFFLVVFKDYHVGFATAFLTAGLGVGQFFTKIIALQWIFAFTIMAIVFLFTLAVAVPGIYGTDTGLEAGGGDRERAPLLQESN